MSLICIDKKEWDLEVVKDVRNERDKKCVLAVPLSESNWEDKLF